MTALFQLLLLITILQRNVQCSATSDPFHNELRSLKSLFDDFPDISQTIPFIFDFFSKSSKISESCRRTAVSFNESSFWAVQMIDATGKKPFALLEANLNSVGSIEECLEIRSINNNDSVNGQFCNLLVSINNVSLKFNNLNIDQVLNAFLNTAGICIPSSCSQNDLSAVVDELLNVNRSILKFNVGTCYSSETINPKFERYEIFIIVLLSSIALLMVLSTVFEMILSLKKADSEQRLAKLLVSFSIYKNTKKLFSTRMPKDAIDCLCGMRVIGISFIIVGHTYAFSPTMSMVNKLKLFEATKSLMFQFILNGTLWVDVFFLMSGTLVTYILMEKYREWHKQAERIGNRYLFLFYYVKNIFISFLHRYIRLTPSLALLICVAIIGARFGSGPHWDVYDTRISNPCKKNWLSTILYLNNFAGDNCLGITWYLANDFQFYLISPFLLLLLSSSVPAMGLLLTTILFVGSILATGIITAVNSLQPTLLLEDLATGGGNIISEIYMRPYTRVNTFCIGVILGYFLRKYRYTNIPKMVNVLLWVVSVVIIVGVTLAPYGWINGGNYSIAAAATYAALNRPVWTLGWSYIIFACSTGNGGIFNEFLSSNSFKVLSKLTYQAYIVHYILIYMHIGSNHLTFYFSHYNIFHISFGLLVLTYLCSYLSYIAFEVPIANLEQILRTAKRPNEIK